MKIIKVANEEWARGLKKLAADYRLFAPVADKDSFEFKEIEDAELIASDFDNTRLSPKSVVYPKTQPMFSYTLDESAKDSHIMKPIPQEGKPKLIVGARPCDAASFTLSKKNFDNPDYPDPYWLESFEQTTFAGLACDNPCSTCFCSSVGLGPYSEEGLDILFYKDGDAFTGKTLTEKGEALIKTAGWKQKEDAEDFEGRRKAAEEKIQTNIHNERLKSQKATDLFDAPFWAEYSFACLNCGTCTYSCPTCWCFDIQDEVEGLEGQRMRNWDSCMYPLFTLEASGHNPRPVKEQRFKQRFMHKLKYYPDKYGSGPQCVGCGRCIQLCPVNIDIREICEIMNNYKSA